MNVKHSKATGIATVVRRKFGVETSLVQRNPMASGVMCIAARERAWADAEKRMEEDAQCGPTRQLVKNGKWNVPPGDRPAGWEEMGIPE